MTTHDQTHTHSHKGKEVIVPGCEGQAGALWLYTGVWRSSNCALVCGERNKEEGRKWRRRPENSKVGGDDQKEGTRNCIMNKIKGVFATKAVAAPPQGSAAHCVNGLLGVPTNPGILTQDGLHRMLFVWRWSRARVWAEICSL